VTYTSLISFHVAPGRAADFETAFEETEMLTRPQQIAGYRGAELHRGIDDPDTYIVIGRWDTVDAYRAWQQVSARTAPDALDRLLDTLTELTPGHIFQPLDTPGAQATR
jgi:heme-degrading monooxygenase HmoA